MTVLHCPICEWETTVQADRTALDKTLADHIADTHSAISVAHALRSMTEKLTAAENVIRNLMTNAQASQRRCGKIGYPDEPTASRELLKAWRGNNARRAERRAYRCDRCPYWHLTSKESHHVT